MDPSAHRVNSNHVLTPAPGNLRPSSNFHGNQVHKSYIFMRKIKIIKITYINFLKSVKIKAHYDKAKIFSCFIFFPHVGDLIQGLAHSRQAF